MSLDINKKQSNNAYEQIEINRQNILQYQKLDETYKEVTDRISEVNTNIEQVNNNIEQVNNALENKQNKLYNHKIKITLYNKYEDTIVDGLCGEFYINAITSKNTPITKENFETELSDYIINENINNNVVKMFTCKVVCNETRLYAAKNTASPISDPEYMYYKIYAINNIVKINNLFYFYILYYDGAPVFDIIVGIRCGYTYITLNDIETITDTITEL